MSFSNNNNQLLLELLQFSNSIASLQNNNNLQLLSLQQSNSLFNFNPQLLQFSSQCGNSFNTLSNFISSPLNSLLINLNNGQTQCLQQLIQLEQLFLSGNSNINLNNNNNGNNGNNNDNNNNNNDNNNNNNLNSTDVSNSTASVDANAANATTSANVSATAEAAVASDTAKAAKDGKKKKGEKRDIIQRSGASKMKVLGSLGFGALLLAGSFAL